MGARGDQERAEERGALLLPLLAVLLWLSLLPAVQGLARENIDAARTDPDSDVVRFYAACGCRLAWSRDSADLLAVLGGAAADGLDPADYAVPPAGDAVQRDVSLTRAALRYARDLSRGRLPPSLIDTLWQAANTLDPVEAVLAAWQSGRVASLPQLLRPPHAGYDALRAHLSGPDAAVVAVNLERWRWLPRDLGARRILVDIPAFTAWAVDGDSVVVTSRVVVGRVDWPTPIVSGAADRLVFSPAWTVPSRIVREEILPAARRDVGWLTRHGYTVYFDGREVPPDTIVWAAAPDSLALRFRFVMPPGTANPLGGVKLPLASGFSVALHDTPERKLFADTVPAFSHGCVRVERMAELVAWLLAPTGWSADSVQAAVRRREASERPVPLALPVPIHVTYFTAAVDADGRLVRRRDVYGWDRRLAAAIGSRGDPRRNLTVPSGSVR